jgi:peptide/nickel transport system substrate-binding protein
MKKLFALFVAAALLAGMTAGAALAQAPRAGGTLHFVAPYDGDLLGLDPHKTTRIQESLVLMNIFRSLYRWDPDKNMPVLDLAAKVDVSPDGLKYTYHLHKNVKFHNGRIMNADDIIYSYNRIASPKLKSPWVRFVRIIQGAGDVIDGKAQTISGLKKIDDFTLEITLQDPVDPSFSLRECGTSIVPKEAVEGKEDAFHTTSPVGCGPFKFVRWVKGSEVVLEKFPEFFMQGKPLLDKVVYKIQNEASARDMAFRAKELDATIVGSAQYEAYKNDPTLSKNMMEVAEMFTRLVGYNMDFEPFKKKEVRQAIAYAMDKELIIKKLLKDKAFLATSYLPTSSPAFDKNLKPYPYDPKKAKELMVKAGYPNGFTIEQAIGTGNESWGVVVYEAMIPYLKEIGITMKIQQMEGAAMAERNKNGEFQTYIWSLGSGPDSLQQLKRWSSENTQAGGNYGKYKNPEFDKLLAQAAAERDQAKQIELLKKADAVLYDDPPAWFFNYNKAVMAYHPWVKGLKPVAIEMMFQDMTEVWVDASSPRANVK